MQVEEVIPGYYLCKLTTGVAYYLVHARAYEKWHTEYNGQDPSVQKRAYYAQIQVEHLLSIGSKWDQPATKVLIIKWQDLPKTYQLDVIACRLEFREKYYEGIYGHKPDEVNNLKDRLFAIVGEATGNLSLLRATGIQRKIGNDWVDDVVPVKSVGGNIPSYPQSRVPVSWMEHTASTKLPTYEEQSSNNQQTNNMDLLQNIPGMNLSFGKLPSGRIALSMTGELAFKDNKTGGYVTIQTEGNEKTRVDVGSLKFDVDFYQVPTQDLVQGDVILLDNDLLIVGTKANGEYAFINPLTGAKTTKLQRSNILGMYFYTKVVSLFNMVGGEASGIGLNGIDPMMLMLMSGQGGQLGVASGSNDIGQLLVLSQLSQAKGNSNLSSMLPLLLMSGGNGGSLNGGGIGQLLLMQALGGNGGGLGNLFGKKKATAKPVVKNNKRTPAKKSPVKRTTAAG